MRLIDADLFDAIVNDDGTIDENATEIAKNAMLAMPSVDAVPVRHGKWVDITESHIGTCSLCGDRWGSVDMMNYCPSCGARMDAE